MKQFKQNKNLESHEGKSKSLLARSAEASKRHGKARLTPVVDWKESKKHPCTVCWGRQKTQQSLTRAVDWLHSSIGRGRLVLVVSHLFAIPILVLWVGLEKSKCNKTLMGEIFFAESHTEHRWAIHSCCLLRGPSSQRLEILLCLDRSGIRVWGCGSIWKRVVGKEEEEVLLQGMFLLSCCVWSNHRAKPFVGSGINESGREWSEILIARDKIMVISGAINHDSTCRFLRAARRLRRWWWCCWESPNSQIRCAGRNEEGVGNGRLGFCVVD
jgi:hypothetical protein